MRSVNPVSGKAPDGQTSAPYIPPLKQVGFTALWSANIIAALAFSAGHLGSAMFIFDVTNPLDLPALVLLMIFALNGLVGSLAGWLFITEGLIAAAGVRFWVDIVWHVIYGLFQ